MGEKGDDMITLSKDTFYGIVIVVLAGLLLLSIFTSGFGLVKANTVDQVQNGATNNSPTNNPSGNVQGGNTNPPANPNAVLTLEVPSLTSSAPTMGSATSGITVLEFSDYQCPFCGLAYGSPWASGYAAQYGPIIGTVKKLETDYVGTGKVNFKHFPVAFLGQESVDSSNAALCAGTQNLYFKMHDAIFEHQTNEENNGKYSKANLKAMAQNISGLDTTAFDSCLDADTYVQQISAMTADCSQVSKANQIASGVPAAQAGLGTPTFYVAIDSSKFSEAKVKAAAESIGYEWGKSADGKTYVILGNPEYTKLKSVIDALLN
ncbi:MAG: thioredoxin domain-containing protein [Candidatus Micrarchaeota archaeon]